MLIVPKTPDGEFKIEEIIEVLSLETFASERNKRTREIGVEHHHY
jgi:hypothetical protein